MRRAKQCVPFREKSYERYTAKRIEDRVRSNYQTWLWAGRPRKDSSCHNRWEGLERETMTFDTFTSSLKELCEWLREKEVTHVAMESTGVYWKPVFNILGDYFKVIL